MKFLRNFLHMTIMLSKTKIISSNIPPTLSLIKRTSSVPAQLRNRDSQTILFLGKTFNKVCVCVCVCVYIYTQTMLNYILP